MPFRPIMKFIVRVECPRQRVVRLARIASEVGVKDADRVLMTVSVRHEVKDPDATLMTVSASWEVA